MRNKKRIKYLVVLWFIMGSFNLVAQQVTLKRVEPGTWWVGMNHPSLQLLVYGENIALSTPEIDYKGLEIVEVHHADNPNYLFIDLKIAPDTKPGTFPIIFNKDKKQVAVFEYKLSQKESSRPATVNASDAIYLITPDRFVNGDTGNDQVKSMQESKNRGDYNGRHGGDLEGVISSIDYLQDLGITALWLNPVLENNMKEVSYHGYSTTDYYKVDPRYGSNEMYKALADELHSRDMKLIMDMIFNHCGLEHWWMKDLPFENWIHDYPDYQITNHALAAISDPHASEGDLDLMTRGWFVSSMPDLNHENEFMANYLIQNSIWWIEYAGLDGIRMDTYPYNNKEMMVEWVERVYKEYPGFYLLGETWVDNVAVEAFWAKKSGNEEEYNSKLASITDFPLCNAIHSSFKGDGDIVELYKVLSKDFVYDNANTNTIFAGNHDMDRFFYTIGENLDEFKLAMTFLLTTRGIPQLYYGDEILMKGAGEHGILREDFPGGWESDKTDAFSSTGRTAAQNEAFEHLKKLLNWRKTSTAISEGDMKHFVPYENVYVYNRKSDDESVLIVINNNEQDTDLNMKRFHEVLNGYSKSVDVITGEENEIADKMKIAGNSSYVLKLIR